MAFLQIIVSISSRLVLCSLNGRRCTSASGGNGGKWTVESGGEQMQSLTSPACRHCAPGKTPPHSADSAPPFRLLSSSG